ncbi:MAG TPA: helix-turn-helix domain-containing protein [Pseudonocardiaceae bacterium]|jgi:transcriptional regulator with XRE-family HTH domain|nr:helix-turn-helix domain-containing protein [Pseudonocardiaceae bacterium]
MAVRVAADEVPLAFGRLLHGHRIRVGLTQRELADLSTISVRAIRDLEQGRARRPRQDTVRLIANGLRLGRQARVDLELAADHGRRGGVPRPDYDADLAAPPVLTESAVVGREPETAVLVGELVTGHRRLVDLVGLSGVGKTRLALEVARCLHAKHHVPVLWTSAPGAPVAVESSIRDDGLATLVRACVCEVFGPAGPDRTTAVTDLADLVADRPTLLVIDGVATRRPRPERIGRLLHDCTGLRVLITSAPPCALPGEWTFLVSPLATAAEDDPNPAAATATRLFADHARMATSDPWLTDADLLTANDIPAVAEICRRLDGMPAALVAAASWLSVYDLDRVLDAVRADPANLLEHISRVHPMADPRDGITRCLGDLPAADRQVLARLCELGEFTLDDVVRLTGRSLPESGRTLRGLLEHGVVRAGQVRGRSSFQVLNLVRAMVDRLA